jgi:hypothetical protein
MAQSLPKDRIQRVAPFEEMRPHSTDHTPAARLRGQPCAQHQLRQMAEMPFHVYLAALSFPQSYTSHLQFLRKTTRPH